MGDLHLKTIVIAGACTPVGAALSRGLSARGAMVIAIDRDWPALLSLAKADPARIEPMTLNLSDAVACARVGTVWGAVPVQGLVSALSFMPNAQGALPQTEALLSVFTAALSAAQGMMITLAPFGPGRVVAAQAEAQAHQAAALARMLAPKGVRANAIHLAPNLPGDAALDLVAALMGPAGRALSGARLPLGSLAD